MHATVIILVWYNDKKLYTFTISKSAVGGILLLSSSNIIIWNLVAQKWSQAESANAPEFIRTVLRSFGPLSTIKMHRTVSKLKICVSKSMDIAKSVLHIMTCISGIMEYQMVKKGLMLSRGTGRSFWQFSMNAKWTAYKYCIHYVASQTQKTLQ